MAAKPPAETPEPKYFDLAQLDILAPSNEGKPFQLVHFNGTPYRTSTGEPVTVTLLGRNSEPARSVLKQLGDETAEIMRTKGRDTTEDERVEHDTRYLCALTKDWNIERLDGEVFNVTPANIRKLWTDPRWFFLRNRAIAFAAADGLFLPPPG